MILVIAEKKVLRDSIATSISEHTKVNGSERGVTRVEYPNRFTSRVGEYTLVYLAGHALELVLPNEKWSLSNLPLDFKGFPKKEKEEKKDLLLNLKTLLHNAEEVINAGDMDDEGQALVDEVLSFYHYTGKVKRLNTADTTSEALWKNLQSLHDNEEYRGQRDSAEARSRMDAIFGLNYTQYFSLTSGNGKVISLGRVQTPTLRLVVSRDERIENFTPHPYYEIYAISQNKEGECKVKLTPKEEYLDGDGYLSNITEVKNILSKISYCFDYKGKVESKERNISPPLCFNLSTLSLLLEKKYGYTPTEVMEITQSLRDKYNAITYNRSECEYLPSSYFENRKEHVATVLTNIKGLGDDVLDSINEHKDYRSKVFNDEKITLHFAIIPQDVSLNVDRMTERERNVYKEICTRFLMQFLGDKKVVEKTLTIPTSEGTFKCSSSSVMEKGWSILGEKDEGSVGIPFSDGEGLFSLKDFSTKECKTSPPSFFTQATLQKAMSNIVKYAEEMSEDNVSDIKKSLLKKDEGLTGDKGSIGTSATREKVITDLIKRGYLTVKGSNNSKRAVTSIVSTPLGKEFIHALPPSLSSLETTVRMAEEQEKIKEGELSIDEVVKEVEKSVSSTIDNGIVLSLKSTECVRESEKSYYTQKNGKALFLSKSTVAFFSLKKKDIEDILLHGKKELKDLHFTSKNGKKCTCNGEVEYKSFNENYTVDIKMIFK